MIRPEIQALRAVAVSLVVVFHFWPDVLPGGFVGVDVFFVISGFLITSQILHGGLSIGAFWARRARRILPASMFVLLACTVATEAFVPTVHWDQFLTDIRWSALYAQNAHLAGSAVDYFAAADAPSPVHHYWSLSVEEQFYAVWPVLLLLGRRAAAVAVVIAAATLLSLAWSIHTTAANPAPAYFATPGRAWEFGAGALLATRESAAARPWLGWAGLAAIAAAAALYGPGTPFPGVAGALPVLGAAAVIAARCAPPRRLLASAPVQFTGDISYGIYLWHWPLLVIAPYALPAPRGALLVLTLVLAALGKRLIEDPLRRGPLLARPTWTFAGAALATSAVIAASALGSHRLQREIRTADREEHAVLAAHPRCFGAAARDTQRPCKDSRLRLTVIPTPAQARLRPNSPCQSLTRHGYIEVCTFGVRRAQARRSVALVGDSHASHWRAAVDVLAHERGWRGYSVAHPSCPFSTEADDGLREPARSQCRAWNRQVLAWLSDHPQIKTLIVAALGGERASRTNGPAGYLGAWKALPASIENIVVIRDTPEARLDTGDCVERAMSAHKPAGQRCRIPRREAIVTDAQAIAARRYSGRPLQLVDMNDFICDARWCYPVVGGALVFKDRNHLTEVFARTLGPYLARAIR